MAEQQVERLSGGSRAVHYGFLGIAAFLGGYIWWATGDLNPAPVRPMPSMYPGAEIDAPITLVTADKQDLTCAWQDSADGYHCAYQTPDQAWPDFNDKDPGARKMLLAPYKTIDDILFLIPGMFEDPAVDERYRDEPPGKKPRDKLERFTAQCKLKLLREVDGVRVKWFQNGDWQGPHKVWIGVPTSCQVSEP